MLPKNEALHRPSIPRPQPSLPAGSDSCLSASHTSLPGGLLLPSETLTRQPASPTVTAAVLLVRLVG